MIDFPKSTVVHRRLPKEAFYKHLSLAATLKARFVTDVDREIMLLSIVLKKRDFDGKIVEAIARQNPHKLIFLLEYENECQLAVYHSKLYRTEWMKEQDLSLGLSGDTLNEIWDDLVRQIAVSSEAVLKQEGQTIDEQLKTQDEIDRLNTLIKRIEAAAWREQQPKKRFELYTELQKYKEQLE